MACSGKVRTSNKTASGLKKVPNICVLMLGLFGILDGTINPLPDYQLVLYPDPEEIYQHITGDYEISLSASLSHEGKDHSHPIITRRGHVDVEKWIEECVRDELGFIYRQPPKATLKL